MKPIPMNIAKGVALFVTLAAGVVLSFGGHADCAVTINAMYDATIANGLNPGDKAWAAKGVTQYAVALDTVMTAYPLMGRAK